MRRRLILGQCDTLTWWDSDLEHTTGGSGESQEIERDVVLRSAITLVVILSNCQLIEINNDCQLPSHPILSPPPSLTWSLRLRLWRTQARRGCSPDWGETDSVNDSDVLLTQTLEISRRTTLMEWRLKEFVTVNRAWRRRQERKCWEIFSDIIFSLFTAHGHRHWVLKSLIWPNVPSCYRSLTTIQMELSYNLFHWFSILGVNLYTQRKNASLLFIFSKHKLCSSNIPVAVVGKLFTRVLLFVRRKRNGTTMRERIRVWYNLCVFYPEIGITSWINESN